FGRFTTTTQQRGTPGFASLVKAPKCSRFQPLVPETTKESVPVQRRFVPLGKKTPGFARFQPIFQKCETTDDRSTQSRVQSSGGFGKFKPATQQRETSGFSRFKPLVPETAKDSVPVQRFVPLGSTPGFSRFQSATHRPETTVVTEPPIQRRMQPVCGTSRISPTFKPMVDKSNVASEPSGFAKFKPNVQQAETSKEFVRVQSHFAPLGSSRAQHPSKSVKFSDEARIDAKSTSSDFSRHNSTVRELRFAPPANPWSILLSRSPEFESDAYRNRSEPFKTGSFTASELQLEIRADSQPVTADSPITTDSPKFDDDEEADSMTTRTGFVYQPYGSNVGYAEFEEERDVCHHCGQKLPDANKSYYA
uniref:Uncharacterized protein n=1 Tax=Panagrolaimus sp. JU765 TaxID=591449 RepID=A0AC34R0L0_9BILA